MEGNELEEDEVDETGEVERPSVETKFETEEELSTFKALLEPTTVIALFPLDDTLSASADTAFMVVVGVGVEFRVGLSRADGSTTPAF